MRLFLAEGVSHNACSTTYCGSQGGSEPEVEAIQREARRLGRFLIGWVTLHSYGRMWVFPYGGTLNQDGKTCLRTDDYDDLVSGQHYYKSRLNSLSSCLITNAVEIS